VATSGHRRDFPPTALAIVAFSCAVWLGPAGALAFPGGAADHKSGPQSARCKKDACVGRRRNELTRVDEKEPEEFEKCRDRMRKDDERLDAVDPSFATIGQVPASLRARIDPRSGKSRCRCLLARSVVSL
jgi:hypothetical protein